MTTIHFNKDSWVVLNKYISNFKYFLKHEYTKHNYEDSTKKSIY